MNNIENDNTKRTKNLTCLRILIIIIVLAQIGCHLSTAKNFYINPKKISRIKSIAVLPFYNLTENLNAETIIANVFMAELLKSKRFDVIKYGDCQALLLDKKITSLSTIDIEMLHLIRKRLKADAVIIGTIYIYDDVTENGAKSSKPVISTSLSLIETKLGQIIWRADLTKTGSFKGYLFDNKEIYTCFGLTQRLAKELVANIKVGNGDGNNGIEHAFLIRPNSSGPTPITIPSG